MAKTTVEFSDQAANALATLASRLSKTKAEVLRDALSLYGFIVQELSSGRRQLGIVEDETDVKKIVVVPGIQAEITPTRSVHA